MEFTVKPNGDRAVLAMFPNEISEQVNARVLALCAAVEKAGLEGIVGCVPAYCTLLVEYDPLRLRYHEVEALLAQLEIGETYAEKGRSMYVPVCYGGEYGPDLAEAAVCTGLTQRELVRRHTASRCRVYMLGFRPGFPFLGGMDESIAVPRRKTPRTQIAAGSVGIAGKQTGIYPEVSPGGWNIIGRTPLKLFSETEGALLHPGDILRFRAVSAEEFTALENGGEALAAWERQQREAEESV